MPARAVQRRSQADRVAETRQRILDAVHDLLVEGVFHETTVEQVAQRAGVSRAGLYQHFRSRLELVDAICDWMAINPALVELRQKVELEDAELALSETIKDAMRFWATEDPVIAQLYGVVAVDPAAADFVRRQREDRRGEMERLARNLRRAGSLRPGLGEQRALARLMVLTSYETYRELTELGMSEREITRQLQDDARATLLGSDG